MKNFKSVVWWVYLFALHLVVLFALLSIPEIRKRFQAERQLPGSQIRSEHDEYPDGGWVRVFTMDNRDPVMAIVDDDGWVNHLFVQPPDTRYVWSWDRTRDTTWTLMIAEYDSVENAQHHFDAIASRVVMDGYPYNNLDGFIDREMIIEDNTKMYFSISPPDRSLDHESPVQDP